MNSILTEISKLRKWEPFTIDYKNSNRYRVVAINSNGTKSAYYFSVPIYNNKTLKAIDLKFYSDRGIINLVGSSANITISDNIHMESSEGYCDVSLPSHTKFISKHKVICDNTQIFPTTNGVSIRSACLEGKGYTFTLEISKPFLRVNANDKYFALMSEQFRPFVSLSCLGTVDASNNIISPAKLTYQKISNCKYTLTISPCSTLGKSVVFELNLYEEKLFQDTTVESKNPKTNNAFGSVGFIGSTEEFGEQWLYTRTDFSKIKELNDKKILSAILHIPRLNYGTVNIVASKVYARFCSFGATWDNKIESAYSLDNPQITDHYIDLNMMPILTDKYGRFIRGEGFIIKAQKKDSGFIVIATGDNYFAPQILEICYR